MTTGGSTSGGPGRGRGAVGAPAWATSRSLASAVARPRLLRRLDVLERAAIIRAATGYGKTVLAAQWADTRRAAGQPVAWTAGPWTHHDPWPVVRDALTGALRAHGVDVPADASPTTLAGAVAAVDGPVVLVVDDADQLDDPDAVKAVAELVSAAPTLQVLVITATRYPLLPTGAQHPVLTAVEPPLRVVTITARDLSFTPDELADAAASWGHPVDEGRLAYLVGLVGGWPKLAREVLDDTRPDDTHLATAGAYAFTRDVILPAVQDSPLTETAMLVAATGDPTPENLYTAMAAAGRTLPGTDAVEVLLRLEGVGVLVRDRTGGGPSRWRMPALLRELLWRELARRDPVLSGTVHSALARAAMDAHPPDAVRAVDHASRAHDWTLLESCWLSFGPYLIAAGGPAVDAVYAAVPDDVVETSTALGVARATARRGRDERDEPRDLVLRLMSELGTLALDGRWRCRTAAGRWFGAASALVAARARGDLPRAMAVLRETELAAASAGSSGETSGRPYWWFLVQAGRTALLDGDLGGSLELATRAYELANPTLAPDVRAASAAHLALVHVLDGALSDADRWLVRYVEALDPAWEEVMRDRAAETAEALLALEQLDLRAADAALCRLDESVRGADVAWPLVLRAHVRRAVLLGDPTAGLVHLDEVDRTHHVWLEQPGLARNLVQRMRAELMLFLGELHDAADLLASDPTGAWSDVPRARWHLLTGDPHAALRVTEVGGRRRGVGLADRIALLALAAWAAYESKDPAGAVKAFRTARRLADPQGGLFVFAVLPAAVRDALVAEARLPFDDDAQERLAAIGDVAPTPVQLVPLTPRERTVLRLLNEHGTVREVADVLTVSVNTVRKQVMSVYAKLGVHDREAALRRARELGLLGPDAPSR